MSLSFSETILSSVSFVFFLLRPLFRVSPGTFSHGEYKRAAERMKEGTQKMQKHTAEAWEIRDILRSFVPHAVHLISSRFPGRVNINYHFLSFLQRFVCPLCPGARTLRVVPPSRYLLAVGMARPHDASCFRSVWCDFCATYFPLWGSGFPNFFSTILSPSYLLPFMIVSTEEGLPWHAIVRARSLECAFRRQNLLCCWADLKVYPTHGQTVALVASSRFLRSIFMPHQWHLLKNFNWSCSGEKFE